MIENLFVKVQKKSMQLICWDYQGIDFMFCLHWNKNIKLNRSVGVVLLVSSEQKHGMTEAIFIHTKSVESSDASLGSIKA